MTAAEIKAQLNGVFRDVFDDNALEIFEEMTAKDVEDWDSLNHINLVVAVERSFRVRLTTREVSALEKVGDLIDLLGKKVV
jgi:acyl carrier protein